MTSEEDESDAFLSPLSPHFSHCLVDSFYKGHRFNPWNGLRIRLSGEPAIDTGGVRKQVFSDVFQLQTIDRLGLFEGPPHKRRPVFRISSLSAGMMKLLGRMIGRNILLEVFHFYHLPATSV